MIRDIAVALNGSDEDEVRLAHAEALATAFDAHLDVVQVHLLPEILAITDPAGSAFLQTLLDESNEEAGGQSEALRARCEALPGSWAFRRIDAYADALGQRMAEIARATDLYLTTAPYRTQSIGAGTEEAVLFGSGRGCFFIPPGLREPRPLSTVFVAWKETREAAHALAEAMPILKQAREVIVGLVEGAGASEQFGEEAGADLGAHLSRHGVSAELRHITGWSNVGEALLNEAKSVNADLIVMGAYGHSRLRELILGGATRDILSKAAIPVFATH